jgi:hypothetical protein
MALSVPLSRFTSRVGGGPYIFVRRHERHDSQADSLSGDAFMDFAASSQPKHLVVVETASRPVSILRGGAYAQFAGFDV